MTDSWQIDKLLTDNLHLHPPLPPHNQTLKGLLGLDFLLVCLFVYPAYSSLQYMYQAGETFN